MYTSFSGAPASIGAVARGGVGGAYFRPMARPTGGKAKSKAKAAKAPPSKKKKAIPFSFTPAKQAEFLKAYSDGGSVSMNAKKVGVDPTTVFAHARNDEDFAKKYLAAQQLNIDHLEDTLERHALTGNVTAIFGCLRARRPAVWREQHTVTHNASQELTAAFIAAMGKVQGSVSTAS